jgi:hypothetical protein
VYGLKEWQVVADAILEEKHLVLLRKGGILDSQYDFPPNKREFVIFPTYEHQKIEYIKPQYQYLYKQSDERYQITLFCKLIECFPIQEKKYLEYLVDYTIYTYEFLEMKFNYRPLEPLNVLFIEPYKLVSPKEVEYNEHLRGCKSWVELGQIEGLDDKVLIFSNETMLKVKELINEFRCREKP